MREKKSFRPLAAALAAAAVLTLLAGLGALRGPDLTVSDAWYQSRSASDGDIVLVGIDGSGGGIRQRGDRLRGRDRQRPGGGGRREVRHGPVCRPQL